MTDFDRNWIGPAHMRPRIYRTQNEKDIWMATCVENEYRLPSLRAEDVVIDIGAHIGAFAYRAYFNGSRNVRAFECNPWHYEAGCVNLAGLEDGVGYTFAGVVRGDKFRSKEYHTSEESWTIWEGEGHTVPTYSLDEIISAVEAPVRFLKIDCEGSEFPILYTSERLGDVREIAGEYHVGGFTSATNAEFAWLSHPCTTLGLKEFLTKQGFLVNIGPITGDEKGGNGNFSAIRIRTE